MGLHAVGRSEMVESYYLMWDPGSERRCLVRKAGMLPRAAKSLARKLRPGVKWKNTGMFSGRPEKMDIVNPLKPAKKGRRKSTGV